MKQSSKDISRRGFLSRCSALALGGAGAYATLGQLQLAHAAGLSSVQGGTDYRALVCVFLFGGSDSFNMVVPRDASGYAEYQAARQSLAVARDELLAITPMTPQTSGYDYGFHPAMAPLLSRFEAGTLGVIANVGTMLRPVSQADYIANNVLLPKGLFSHNDQQRSWQSLADSTAGTGWAGRAADFLSDNYDLGLLPMNVSINGQNRFQTGAASGPFTMKASGAARLNGLNGAREDAFFTSLKTNVRNPFAEFFSGVQDRGIDLNGAVADALENVTLQTQFPAENQLASKLRAVAQLIAGRGELGASRQIYFVGLGGFDTHSDQNIRQPALLGAVASALDAFQSAIDEIGASENVVTFTASDFGRTMSSNGDGSDHGWSGVQLVMGRPVVGGDIYGRMPSLVIGGPDDTRIGNNARGRIIPAVAADQMAGQLVRWYGADTSAQNLILPNLSEFDAAALPTFV